MAVCYYAIPYKKDYSAEIHALFEQLRASIPVKNEFSIIRLELLEMREKSTIESATIDDVKRLKAEVRKNKQKNKIYKLPYAGKKYTVLPSGKIKEEELTK